MTPEGSPRERLLRLSDGRMLSYAEWGPIDGIPVFGFHGTPNSRLVHLGAEAPVATGVRLILPDRPGLGRSEYQDGRTLGNWPRDVAELADSLGVDRFAVFGVSGGGPHAAACAALLRSRVFALGLVSAVGPVWDRPSITAATPEAWRRITELARSDAGAAYRQAHRACQDELELLSRDPDAWVRAWDAAAPHADRELIADATVLAMYVDSCAEATLEGYVRDLIILTTLPWGFALEDIDAPTYLWHGDDDRAVPLPTALETAGLLPCCTTTVFEGEGHLLVHKHSVDILHTLAGARED